MYTSGVGGVELLGLSAAAFTLFFLFRSRGAQRLPPGPKGLPVVGNVLDMPQTQGWLTYAEWGQKWGPLLSVRLLGQTIVIVNSATVMEEMDKRGAIYSDRPRLEMGGELVGYVKTLVLSPYGPRLRNFRRHVARLIGSPSAVTKFAGLEEHSTRKFLKALLAEPENLEDKLRRTSGAIIMSLSYGIEVQEKDDPFVKLIEHANDNFSIVTTPGAFLVDVFPFLRHVPAWFPGAEFKRLLVGYKKAFDDMVEVPYRHAVNLVTSGKAPMSFISSSLENGEAEKSEDYLDEIKHTAASLYGAGADTTVSDQHAFFLAMILHPEVQRKAQAEIDSVVGKDRLPTFADRPHLPYINAVVTETLRWHQVAPLGVPHRVMEDDAVGGYFIPKDSIVIANLWAMLHDPEVYPSPHEFDPDRFLSSDGRPAQRDPRHACFGFARRICPGMHLADASLFILIAMTMSVFDISAFETKQGVFDVPVHGNTDGTISHPTPFKYKITPRSEKAAALVMAESF